MFVLGMVIGLVTSPFLLLSVLAWGSGNREPLTKEEWRQLDD